MNIFVASGYRPGLSQRLRRIAVTAAGSSDPYMRNAAARLAAGGDGPELVSWVNIVIDNCRQAIQPSGVKVFQAPAPTVATPAPSGIPPASAGDGGALGAATRGANENAEAIRKLTEQYRALGGAIRDVNPSLPAAPAPAPMPSPAGPPQGTSSEAADRQLRGVLEREGATGAACTKKQYGGSWVSVCD